MTDYNRLGGSIYEPRDVIFIEAGPFQTAIDADIDIICMERLEGLGSFKAGGFTVFFNCPSRDVLPIVAYITECLYSLLA